MLKIFTKILDLIFPEQFTCNFCGEELKEHSSSGLCENCESALIKNNGNKCQKCSSPILDESKYCLNCQNNKRYFDSASSVFVYTGVAKTLINRFKTSNQKYLYKTLVYYMLNEFAEKNFPADILVSVPMSDKKLKKRGYNQSALLAGELAKRLNVSYCDCLIKTRDTLGQHELPRAERLTNLNGAFSVTDKNLVKGKSVVIIDDTFTTGSTVSEIAKELYEAGAASVNALCFAATKLKADGESVDDEIIVKEKFGVKNRKKYKKDKNSSFYLPKTLSFKKSRFNPYI